MKETKVPVVGRSRIAVRIRIAFRTEIKAVSGSEVLTMNMEPIINMSVVVKTVIVGVMMQIAAAAKIRICLMILDNEETSGKVTGISHLIGQKIRVAGHVPIVETYRYVIGQLPDPKLNLILIVYGTVNYFVRYVLTTSTPFADVIK